MCNSVNSPNSFFLERERESVCSVWGKRVRGVLYPDLIFFPFPLPCPPYIAAIASFLPPSLSPLISLSFTDKPVALVVCAVVCALISGERRRRRNEVCVGDRRSGERPRQRRHRQQHRPHPQGLRTSHHFHQNWFVSLFVFLSLTSHHSLAVYCVSSLCNAYHPHTEGERGFSGYMNTPIVSV